eukprot:PhF_6_TR27151/c0_g1_i1/m.39658
MSVKLYRFDVVVMAILLCCGSVIADASKKNKHMDADDDQTTHSALRENMKVYNPTYPYPNLKRTHTILKNGHHHVLHSSDFSHTYPHPSKRNRTLTSYVKLHSNLTHAPHWRFVCLRKEQLARCTRSHLVVSPPSTTLLRMLSILQEDNVHHTSIVIHSTAHACFIDNAKEGMFRSIESFTVSEDKSTVTFTSHHAHNHMSHFANVFSEADIRLDTNILPKGPQDVTEHRGEGTTHYHHVPQSHHMNTLGWWSDLGRAVCKAATDVLTVVAKVVDTVADAINEGLAKLIDFKIDKSQTLASFEWGGSRDSVYSRTGSSGPFNIIGTGQYSMEGWFRAELSIHLEVHVRGARLSECNLYLKGEASAVLRLALSTTLQVSTGWSKDIATYYPPSFFVWPCFYIQPKITLTFGFDLTLNAAVQLSQVVVANGMFRAGFFAENGIKPDFKKRISIETEVGLCDCSSGYTIF